MKDKTKVELKKELEAAKLRISELEAFKKKYTQTEHALKVSEEKLIVQYKSIPVPTYTWQKIDEDFVLVDHNDAAVTITQGKIADYIGKKATEMYRENPEIIEEFSRCFHEKVTINREMPYKFRYSGEEKYLAVKYAFVPPDLVMVHTEDITERKQKELRSQVRVQLLDKLRSLKNIEECLQLGCETIRDAKLFERVVLTLHSDKREIIYLGQVGLDPEFIEQVRKAPPPNESQKKQMMDSQFKISHSFFIPQEARIDYQKTERYAQKQSEARESSDTSWKQNDELFTSIFSKDYEIEGYLSVDTPIDGKRPDRETILYLEEIVDIIVRQIHEIQNTISLQTSEERYRTLAENALDLICELDENGIFRFASPNFKELLGYESEDLTGKKFLKFVHPDDRRSVMISYSESMKNFTPNQMEFRFRAQKGETWRWIESSGNPFRTSDGEVHGVIVSRDITERKRAEKLQDSIYRISQVVESSANLKELYTAVHEIIRNVMPAKNFYIALYNDKEDTLHFPYFIDELDVPPAPIVKPGKGLTTYVLKTGKSFLYTKNVHSEKKLSGEVEFLGVPPLSWLGVPLKIEKKTIGIMAVNHYTDPTAYGEREQHILEFVSTQVAKAIEYKRADDALKESEVKYRQLAETAKDVIMILDLKRNISYINNEGLKLSGYSEDEALGMKINDVLPTDQIPISDDNFMKHLGGKTDILAFEIDFLNKKGDRIPVEVKSSLITKDDKPSGVLIIARDITDRKHLEAQLRQAAKMEAVGRLSSGIAHDFNNVLTVMSGHAELARLKLDPNSSVVGDIDEIEKAAKRGSNLTRQLLTFSRKQEVIPKNIDLNFIIADLRKMLKRLIGDNIKFNFVPQRELWNVKADPGQIEQVIMNLSINAGDAMSEGGELTIATDNIELNETKRLSHSAVKPGIYAMITVQDTGTGMTHEVLTQLFDPFFTTKKAGEGTGMGLSTVHGIVQQSNGYIDVSTKLGKGTIFTIYLPMVEEEPDEEKHDREKRNDEIPRGKGTILVAEDAYALRKLACRILQLQGYRVLEACDGQEAFEICQQLDKPIDMVVTDIVMPNMSGNELVKRLKEMWPHVKVLFISGYTVISTLRKEIADSGMPFLQKPFATSTLAGKVREVMDG